MLILQGMRRLRGPLIGSCKKIATATLIDDMVIDSSYQYVILSVEEEMRET
ncbi:hypothetical protein [Rhizobium azibense]|uniref:Uncharacterized protein n=1 Tax=Rhizobium azibense TaxID=1136135 RepID=A0A4R3RXA1_9HYPH|nr:hypothetical protein [Rhizobium azibense]TCU40928.1 hypothetical protein EV129_101215 [Rhizobium azibense]